MQEIRKNGQRNTDDDGRKAPTEKPHIKVEDRRHWARADEEDDDENATPASTQPTIIDEYRERTEAAEARLQEYIAAYKKAQSEHEEYRLRLQRDVDRKVQLQFGSLVGELLECVDDLDLAIEHSAGIPEARPLAEGVALVRNRFLGALERAGVERIEIEGEPFDPNEAEAVRMDPVDSPDLDGRVTDTVRPGYRLGERVIRPATVAVGKLQH